MNVATTENLTNWTRLELHAPDGSMLAEGRPADLMRYGDDLGWPGGLYVRVPSGVVIGRIVSALLDGCTYAVDGPSLPLVAVALLARGCRVRFGVAPDTCACGAWPVEEYGERCPSCPEPESALRLARWLTTNLGLPDSLSRVQVDQVIDALGNSSVPEALALVGEALR